MVAVLLKEGLSSKDFRAAAKACGDANQARRLLALAAVRDGMGRTGAARTGGMDRQTPRDWAHAFNARGIDGLVNDKPPGRPSKLSAEQKGEIKALAEKPPDIETDGVVRWRRIDLARIAKERFGAVVDEDTIGRVLRGLGFSHIGARPRHPGQKDGAIEAFKKTSRPNSPAR